MFFFFYCLKMLWDWNLPTRPINISSRFLFFQCWLAQCYSVTQPITTVLTQTIGLFASVLRLKVNLFSPLSYSLNKWEISLVLKDWIRSGQALSMPKDEAESHGLAKKGKKAHLRNSNSSTLFCFVWAILLLTDWREINWVEILLFLQFLQWNSQIIRFHSVDKLSVKTLPP